MNQREKWMVGVLGGVVGLFMYNSTILEPWQERYESAKSQATSLELEVESADLVFERRRKVRRTWKDAAADEVLSSRMDAEGELFNYVSRQVSESGLNLTSIAPQREAAQAGFGQINFETRATGDLASIAAFLFAVEQADIPVNVSELSLVSQDDQSGNLTAQFTISTIYDLPKEETR